MSQPTATPPAAPADAFSLPYRLEQSCSRLTAITQLVLLAPIVGATTLIAGSFAVAAADPGVRALATAHPVGGLLGTLGLICLIMLVAWPAGSRLAAIGRTRSVDIRDGDVRVSERGLLANRSFREPLSRYTGLAHVIRTRVSGAHHELVLVHPERNRCVVIAQADLFAKAEIEAACRALGVAEVPARTLYERNRTEPRPRANVGVAPTPATA